MTELLAYIALAFLALLALIGLAAWGIAARDYWRLAKRMRGH